MHTNAYTALVMRLPDSCLVIRARTGRLVTMLPEVLWQMTLKTSNAHHSMKGQEPLLVCSNNNVHALCWTQWSFCLCLAGGSVWYSCLGQLFTKGAHWQLMHDGSTLAVDARWEHLHKPLHCVHPMVTIAHAHQYSQGQAFESATGLIQVRYGDTCLQPLAALSP